MKKDLLYERNKTVTKSNDLIQKGRYTLTINQQRILLYMISQINPNDTEFTPCSWTLTEFGKLCGINGDIYTRTKAEIKELSSLRFWVKLDGQDRLKAWIADDPEPTISNGIITMQLSKSMRPYLLELRERFTSYQLIFVLCFRSKYSIRLYEYICSRHYRELEPYRFTISVDELKEVMSAEVYNRFVDFDRYALRPAAAEINQYTDKRISIEYQHQGRKTTAVEFTVTALDSLNRATQERDNQRTLGSDPDQLTIYDFLGEPKTEN